MSAIRALLLDGTMMSIVAGTNIRKFAPLYFTIVAPSVTSAYLALEEQGVGERGEGRAIGGL